MEGNGLRINMGKTKVLISSRCAWEIWQRNPWRVFQQRQHKFHFCGCCSSWIHKKCSDILGPLKLAISYRYKWCTGQARPINGRLMTEVTVNRIIWRWCHPSRTVTLWTAYLQLAVVNSLLPEDGMSHGQIQRTHMHPQIPLITITSERRVYSPCVKSAMLHASGTCAPTLSHLHSLQRNGRAMIRWMWGVTSKDRVSSKYILGRMQLDDLAPSDWDGTVM